MDLITIVKYISIYLLIHFLYFNVEINWAEDTDALGESNLGDEGVGAPWGWSWWYKGSNLVPEIVELEEQAGHTINAEKRARKEEKKRRRALAADDTDDSTSRFSAGSSGGSGSSSSTGSSSSSGSSSSTGSSSSGSATTATGTVNGPVTTVNATTTASIENFENFNENGIENFTINPASIDYKMGSYSGIKLPQVNNDRKLKSKIYTNFGTPNPLDDIYPIESNYSNATNVDGTPDSPKSMAMFKYNSCEAECCPSTYSCSNGCICQTENQKKFINSRGNNRTSPSEF